MRTSSCSLPLPLDNNAIFSIALYPNPVTTTSPSPHDNPIRYPTLMTKHQMTQGYAPSLESMFNSSMRAPNAPASLLFVSDSKKTSNLYSPSMLPPQSSAPTSTSASHPPSSSIYTM